MTDPGHVLQHYDAIGKLGDRTKGMWTERSIHLLQLTTQLLNHPGTSREGGFPALPPGLPQRSMTSGRLLLCENHPTQKMLLLVLDIAMFAGLLAYLHALKHHEHSNYAAT